MKLVVIGLGQCGSRVADEFARLNRKAQHDRHIEIISGTFAVNTDLTDLSGLSWIKSDHKHRILIGGRKTGGHGVGKVNELGAEIAKEDGDKVIDAIRTTRRFFESDAFLLCASAAGGTGSGSLPVMTQHIKERYGDKPVYDLIVLPFEHEEATEERTIYNTATCLKSCYSVADAVFLIDNQRYIKKDASLRHNLSQINAMMVEPFYDMLCAGEEKKLKFIGGKTLDAGDIMQTVKGWTVIGFGKSQLPVFRFPSLRSSDFRKKSTETHKGIEAMDAAISELSLKCNPSDSGRALYLVASPAKELNMELIKDLGDYLRNLAPEATIRNGDYPREKGALDVTVLFSELRDVEKIRKYYSDSAIIITRTQKRQKEISGKLKDIDLAAKDIPSLI
ncbi:tubulin/FtsZ family protein [Chloroflexota bacterium]